MQDKLLGSLETNVMDFYWQNDSGHSISELHKHLNKNNPLAYTTVSTIVGRLVEKKLLSRSKKDGSFIYQARTNRQDFIANYARKAVRGLLGNFGEVAIAGFVEEIKSDPETLKKLQELTRE